MNIDLRLAAKGEGEPREGLLRQGRVHIDLARHYAAALVESGWSDADTAALEKDVAVLASSMASQAEERATRDAGESMAVGEAKAFLRRLRLALPRALRESVVGVNPHVFDTSINALGRSAPRISEHLARIRPAVELLDGDLAKYFGGRRASKELDGRKRALDRMRAGGQESALAGLPEEILAIAEVKGRLLERIEDLNRAGRIAFEGQAETVGKFNKDILLRARREASQAAPALRATG